MSDQQKEASADANVGWQDLKSEKGEAYRVKASDYDIASASAEAADAPAASGPSFSDVAVNWTVGSSGTTTSDVQNRTAITWYKLERAELFSIYQYKLTVNCADTYDYKFTDQEPDTYRLNVFQNAGTHSLEYRSHSPTIVKISGS